MNRPKAHRIAIAIIVAATLLVNSAGTEADFTQKAVRRFVENAAIIAATATGEQIHNL